jgi:hypothetical protein
MQDFGPKAATTGLLVAMAAGALELEPTFDLWGDALARTGSLGLTLAMAATVFAVFRGGAFERRGVAASMLFAVAAFFIARLGGYEPSESVFHDPRYVVVLLGAVLAAGIGVLRRRRWARWLALSLAFTGATTSCIGLVALPFVSFWLTWFFAVWAIGGALVIVNLVGDTVASDDIVDARDFSQAWPDSVRPAWWLRAAVISALVAAPMLVLYAFGQQFAVRGLVPPALLLAVALCLSTVLVVRGRAIGALLLGVSGLALLVFILVLVGAADFPLERQVACYYIVFWLPAGLAATISGASLARAAFRLTA